ncbi:hypothetical protein AAE478_002530 [Parahypoxylon ruwenzoriense]
MATAGDDTGHLGTPDVIGLAPLEGREDGQPSRDKYVRPYIVSLFESALEPADASSDERARYFVVEVSKLASEEKFGFGVGDFAWEFCEAIIAIASNVPHCNPAQDVLVQAVNLIKTEEAQNPIWEDFDEFGWSVRDHWDEAPGLEPQALNNQTYTATEWLNINSFAARLLGQEVEKWLNFPIWEIRRALESPLTPAPDASEEELIHMDTVIRVATEWMVQSAPILLRESMLNTFADFNESETAGRPYCGGPLWTGAGGYSLERWGFWKRRLAEIRTSVGENLDATIEDALEAMTLAERQLGHGQDPHSPSEYSRFFGCSLPGCLVA